jgi:hypothetical protein
MSLFIPLTQAYSQSQGDNNFTVQALYNRCKSPDPGDLLACYAYLTGVADALQENAFLLFKDAREKDAHADQRLLDEMGICALSYSGQALARAYINWAERNPQSWTSPQIFGARDALIQTWHCQLQ